MTKLITMLNGFLLVHDDYIEVIKSGEEAVKISRKDFDEVTEFEGIPHRIIDYDVQRNEPIYGFYAGEFLLVRNPLTEEYTVIHNGEKLFHTPRKNIQKIKNFLETVKTPYIDLNDAPHQFYYAMGEFIVLTIIDSDIVIARLPPEEP